MINRTEVLQKIYEKKVININHKIAFRTILDVLTTIFTNENHVSTLKIGYKVNDQLHVWFPNITPNDKKALSIKNGYCNYLSDDWNYIYQFDGTKNIEKRKKLGEKYAQEKIKLIVFAKINEKK